MFGIFVGAATAGADILDCRLPSREVPVATIEIRDMPGYPVLKGLGIGKFLHYIRHNVPVDEVSAVEDLLVALLQRYNWLTLQVH